jgi:hypothetical protein
MRLPMRPDGTRWAVGTEDLSAAGRPLLLDWNGRHWIKDAVPGRPATGQMVQVSSASPGTACALGYVGVSGTNLILRWQGHGWLRVPVPGNLRNQTVYSIAGGTGQTARLYGYTDSQGYLLERWNGARWQTIKVPDDLWGYVADMAATGRHDVWLNGYTDSGPSVIAHYDAGRWTSIPPVPAGRSADAPGYARGAGYRILLRRVLIERRRRRVG